MKYETRQVLAGAYVNSDPRTMLTHAVEISDDERTEEPLCKRVKSESICDQYASTPAQLAARPTCKTCARKWDKLPK